MGAFDYTTNGVTKYIIQNEIEIVMNKHKSNKIKENSNTVRHLIMGQITTTQNLVAIS